MKIIIWSLTTAIFAFFGEMPLYLLYYTLCFLTGLKERSPNSGAPPKKQKKAGC